MSDWLNKLEALTILAPAIGSGLIESTPIQQPEISTNESGYSQVQEQQPNSCSLDEKPETSEAQRQYESLPAIARVPSLDSQLENSYSDTGFGSKDSAKQRQEDIDKDITADNQPTISGPPNNELSSQLQQPENNYSELTQPISTANGIKDPEFRVQTPTSDYNFSNTNDVNLGQKPETHSYNIPKTNDNAELANQLRKETYSPSSQPEQQEATGETGKI